MNDNQESKLRQEFTDDMMRMCQESSKLGYTPTYFMDMMKNMDGVDAAHILVGKREWSYGLKTLKEKKRWDLTIEAHVLKDKYSCLFSDEEIKVCEEKREEFLVDNTEEMICPRCGRPLVLRTATKGASAGSNFYGCSAFPECRYTKSVD